MPTITIIATLLQQAAGVYGAWKGTAAEAKVSATLQSALSVIKAFTPLLEQYNNGVEVTLEMANEAATNEHRALDALKAEIAKQGG
jgi:hypothetical protein